MPDETRPPRLTLFGTDHCHLCEEALARVLPVASRLGAEIAHCDIAEALDDPTPYETRIPVLRREDRGTELDWPFDQADVYRFLAPA